MLRSESCRSSEISRAAVVCEIVAMRENLVPDVSLGTHFFNELVEMNQRVNLISRKDTDQVFHHHIGHCLAMAHRGFPSGTELVDWGTGGGLPAVVLAILFPDVQIVAVDATRGDRAWPGGVRSARGASRPS